jgi:Protein of unknown function (DUF1656)
MTGEFDIYGVYFPAFAVFAAIAFVLQLAIKRLLVASGVYRFFWHPASRQQPRLSCHSHEGVEETLVIQP